MFTNKIYIQMLTKEQVLSVLKEWITIEQTGYMNGCADLAGLEDAADQILLLIQPTNATKPQLQQHDVSGRSEQLPLDDKYLKQMFHNMSDCYSGLDMHDEKTEIVPSMSCERFIEAVKLVVTGGNCHLTVDVLVKCRSATL